MAIKTLIIQGYRSIQTLRLSLTLVLAQMIEKVSTTKSISLIRTEEGTQIEGLTPWERLI